MRFRWLSGAIFVFAAWGCSGSGGAGSSAPSMPTPTTNTPPNGATTVNITGQNGAQSFNPNPAPITQGSLVVWHNMDSTVHHIVMNDGSFDGGDIGPGGTSSTMRLNSTGGNYHCTLHPTTMFGSINVATDPAPSPSPSPY
jgi:plastocyanin